MRDILDFKVMVTPLIAKGVYLLLSAFVIVLSLIQMFKGSFWNGIVMLCLGLLVVRIFFEWLQNARSPAIHRPQAGQPAPAASRAMKRRQNAMSGKPTAENTVS